MASEPVLSAIMLVHKEALGAPGQGIECFSGSGGNFAEYGRMSKI